MAAHFRGRHAQLRPHFKNHKCTALAKRQLEAGSAVGITCAKLGEAEVLVDAGVDDILIANQIVGAAKVDRLVALAQRATIRVAVDDVRQAEPIAAACHKGKCTVGVLMEVEIGMGRCGVAPGEPALELARKLIALPGIRFDGIQRMKALRAVADPASSQKRHRIDDKAVATRRLLERAGIPVGVISGGSTSTYTITGEIDGVDEIQAGTYPTMDWWYHGKAPEFEIALSILARVVSRPAADRVVLDFGRRARPGIRPAEDQGPSRCQCDRGPVRGALHDPRRGRAGRVARRRRGRDDPRPRLHDVQSAPHAGRPRRRPCDRRLADRRLGANGVGCAPCGESLGTRAIGGCLEYNTARWVVRAWNVQLG